MENSDSSTVPPVTFPHRLLKWQNNEDILALLNAAVSHPEWISQETKKRPVNGSLVLYNKSDTANFKQDAYRWKMRKDGRMIREDHMKLKVNGKDVITANYAHSALMATFHRRSYATTSRQDIVLVHYLNDLKPESDHSDKIVSLLRNCNAISTENTADVIEELKPIWGCDHDKIYPDFENELKKLVELALQPQINPKMIGESIRNLETYAYRFGTGSTIQQPIQIMPQTVPDTNYAVEAVASVEASPCLYSYTPHGFQSAIPGVMADPNDWDFHNLFDYGDFNDQTSSLSTPPHAHFDMSTTEASGRYEMTFESPRRALEPRATVKTEYPGDMIDHLQPVELPHNRKRPVVETSFNGCENHLIDEVFSVNSNFNEFSSIPSALDNSNKENNRRTSRPRLIDSAYSSCSLATDKDGLAIGGDLSYTHSFDTSDPSPPADNDLNLGNFVHVASVTNYLTLNPLDSPDSQPNESVKEENWSNYGTVSTAVSRLDRSRFSPQTQTSEKNLGMSQEEAAAFIIANCTFDSPKSLATIDSADLLLDHSNHSNCEGLQMKQERLLNQPAVNGSKEASQERLIDDISFAQAFTRQISDTDDLVVGNSSVNGIDENSSYVQQLKQNGIGDCTAATSMRASKITDFSPDWSYPEGGTKVLITGTWSDVGGTYAVVFDSCLTVTGYTIQPGVIRCFCPPHLPANVSLEIVHNGQLISEAVRFEYRSSPERISVVLPTDTNASKLLHPRTPSLPSHNDTPYGRHISTQVQKQLSLDSLTPGKAAWGRSVTGEIGRWRPSVGMAGRGGKSPKGARAKPEDLEELLSHSTTEHQRDRLSSLHRAEAHLTSWLNNPGGTFRGDSPENMFVTEQGKEQDEDGRRMKMANLAQWIIDALPDRIKQDSTVESMETDCIGDSEEIENVDTSIGDFTHFRYADDIRSPLSIRSDCSFLQSPPSVQVSDQSASEIAMPNPSNPESLSELGEFFNASRRPLERNFQELALSDREQRELYEAAKVIQNAYRQYRNRALQQQDIERQAAVVIQSYYRRYKQYCQFKKVHRAVVLIQKHFRRYRSKQRKEGRSHGYEGCEAKYLGGIHQSAEEIHVDNPSSSTTSIGLNSCNNDQMTRDSRVGDAKSFLFYTQPSVRISIPQFSPEEFRKWKQEIAAIRIQHAFRGHYMRKRQAAARKIQKFMRETRQKLQMARASTSAEEVSLPGSQPLFQGDGFTQSRSD